MQQLYLGLLCLYLAPLHAYAGPQDWLRVLRFAEGTSRYDNPYGIAFTGRQFDNSKPHPNTVYCSRDLCSTAHGAYQFLYTTWLNVNGGKNLPMTKANQDAAALKLMQLRGVNPNSSPFTRYTVNKLAPEWASLPTTTGQSYYGQSVVPYHLLYAKYHEFRGTRSED